MSSKNRHRLCCIHAEGLLPLWQNQHVGSSSPPVAPGRRLHASRFTSSSLSALLNPRSFYTCLHLLKEKNSAPPPDSIQNPVSSHCLSIRHSVSLWLANSNCCLAPV